MISNNNIKQTQQGWKKEFEKHENKQFFCVVKASEYFCGFAIFYACRTISHNISQITFIVIYWNKNCENTLLHTLF